MQRQMQSSAEIPVPIQQLAETRHMGELLAVYPRTYRAYPLTIAIVVVFFTGAMGIFAPFTFLPWTYFFLILAISGIGIYLPLARTGSAHRHDQIAMHTEGFIFRERGTTTAYRWDNIGHILRGSPRSEGEGIADIDRITVKTTQDTFRLDGTWEKHARAAMCDRIERGFVSARLPQVIAHYNAGEEIAFETSRNDFLRVSKSGFRDPTELLPWPMVEKAEVGPELVILRKEGRTSDWYHKLVCFVPNAALLKALLEDLPYNSPE